MIESRLCLNDNKRGHGNLVSMGAELKRYILIVAVSVCAAMPAGAQTSDPFIPELKQFYEIRKGDLLKAADRMPAESYDFRPTPDVRTFGQLLAHIIDAQMAFCTAVTGEPRRLNAAAKTSKADLVAALKASFDECDRAFGLMTN